MRLTRLQVLIAGITLCIFYVVFLSASSPTSVAKQVKSFKEMTGLTDHSKASLASTVAVVRYNSERLERKRSLDRYAPFFHTIHHSMPRKADGKDLPYAPDQNVLAEDNFDHPYYTYKANADLMQVILNQHPDVTGILYFHFDAWLDPAGFKNMNYSNVWWPTRRHLHGPSGMTYRDSEPFYGCHIFNQAAKDEATYWPWFWWFFRQNAYPDSLAAHNDVANRTNYGLQKDEFCIGWSDFYYIPRRFFEMYIELSNIFLERHAFHETCVPTMVTLIERSHPHERVVDELNDCWGDCCSANPSLEAVAAHRCGHRMDWQNAEVTHAVLSRLERQQEEMALQW